jgi:hypothetical protein
MHTHQNRHLQGKDKDEKVFLLVVVDSFAVTLKTLD